MHSPRLGDDGIRTHEPRVCPEVDLAGGRVWVGNDGTAACFAPTRLRPRARFIAYRGPILTGSFTFIGGRLWAIQGMAAGEEGGLAMVGPPATCWS